MADETLLSFPCVYPIKAVGQLAHEPERVVRAIIAAHVDDADVLAVDTRPSSGGRYLAVTVTLRASSRAQLDALYRDLSAEPRLVWVI